MAKKAKPARSAPTPLVIPAPLVDLILLGPTDDRRQLQDSPILGDVWLAYGERPNSRQDLLITPHRKTTAADVATAIAQEVTRGQRPTSGSAEVAYLQGLVAARLTLSQLLGAIVPLTYWWGSRNIPKELAKYDPPKLQAMLRELFQSLRQDDPDRPARGIRHYEYFTALDRYLALAGLLMWAETSGGRDRRQGDATVRDILDLAIRDVNKIVERLLKIYAEMDLTDPREIIFQVSLNRKVSPALERSVPAVKGDAARSLFKVDTRKIGWAVIDSGIDREHLAFLDRDQDAEGTTRVVKSLDFTRMRRISCVQNQMQAGELRDLAKEVGARVSDVRDWLKVLRDDAAAKRPTNWEVAERLLLVGDTKPEISHGTHVAGIIGARKHKEQFNDGMCPDIRLYDFRVLAKTEEDTEFAVIGALQYIRYINERHSYTSIHGANLSLSIPHNVRNYACGRTPVCNECQRLIESGVVVVAAAGNRGYQRFETKDGLFEGYAAFSITDPGNADDVITVGATHGNWPHTYGVSYFSSRGPTGDGRPKPDLVAPGERIEAPVPGNTTAPESGTSMAAPHVSGAAAMLMARYPELIGNPRRIKKILCESATDLDRERSFQGHGMLDVLRAFQSI
ncbi:MAG TPA: S8 family peptidase [Vicinamibacterales bacterium]|jgi:hypothetical protein